LKREGVAARHVPRTATFVLRVPLAALRMLRF
jgi:hypothetical protein